ncbi:MAG: prolyl oligopeptidase family serine peptidase [Planctomycetota bacterium]
MHVALALFSLSLSFLPVADDYRQPPADVVKLVAAEPAPSVSFSPSGDWMLLVERDAMPSIEDVARPLLRLAGIRIDPSSNGRFQTSYAKGLLLQRAEGGEPVRVPMSDGAGLVRASWSHDDRHFAFWVVTDVGTELWLGNVDAPGEPALVSQRVNTVLASPTWAANGDSVVFLEVPAERGSPPDAPARPQGPNVRESRGALSPLRTYQDLLSSQHDEALFEHYATSIVAIGDSGGTRTIGAPGLHMGIDPAPDGEHLLVTTLRRPFSYVMPYYRFPHRIEVWSGSGERMHTVADVPLGDGIPIGGVRTGPRDVQWSPAAELLWVEALDGGDPNVSVEHRDRWMASPSTGGTPNELFRVEQRATGIAWIANQTLFVASEYDRDRRWTRSLLRDVRDLGAEPRVLEDRSVRDRYGDPGRFVMQRSPRGFPVIATLKGFVWRTGQGQTSEGARPFLDRQSLSDLSVTRIWQSSADAYETVEYVSPYAEQRFVTRRESPVTPPNYFLHEGADVVALTNFPDPTPELRGIKKELVTYERADGVPLSGTLYLPADHEPGERLPLFVWAYPVEYNDASTAGQVSGSPNRFTRISGPSHLALVTQGYAVLDGATMPIIGDPETMNDTFVEQIVAASQAAIDYCVERGVADRERVAVGGHSYGAFMTANLLAHCDLFRAGIARSGAYNRTLTPFGFQSERRTIWEATDAYIHVSPFFVADRIDEPLLLIHGEVDNNSGTYPMQSERLFAGIQGNGGTARLVMLPHESHGYRAEESVLHVLAEMIDWLDEHVKGLER